MPVFSAARFSIFIALLFIPFLTHAQTYPATIRIPVTYYDFHSDLSNPEFETVPTSGTTPWVNMVDSNLVIGTDGKPKPVLGPHPFFNLDIAKWFVPWTPGDSTIPNYGTVEYPVANAAGLTPKFIKTTTDTAFKNMVFQDTLTFTYVPNSAGLYQFVDANFFPLDGRGFGLEGKNHNFSYTMELHTQFQMTPGLTFAFTGDDDVWAFLNNKLAMDLGGRHGPLSGSINVDNIPGLVVGKKYNFDFFYCERHTTGADIKITTNLFTLPAAVKIYAVTPPNYADTTHPIGSLDSASSGIPLNLAAHVFDSTGTLRPEFDSLITWTMTESTPLGTKITKISGDSTAILPSKAYGIVTLTATYKDPSNPNSPTVVKTIQVYIGPGKPHSLEIDTSFAINLAADTAVKSIVMDTNRNTAPLYAIVRDSVGNFVDSAKAAVWTSSDPTLGTVTASGKRWQSTVTKVKPGMIIVTVSSAGLISTSITVTLLTVHIDNKIYSGPVKNPVGPINPINTNTTLLFYQNVISKAGGSIAGGSVPGAIIGIETLRQLVPNPNGSFGEAAVYDALGNLVVKGLRVDKAESQSSGDHHLSYGIYWDCHNRDHRWVGNGTYLVVASITTTDGVTLTTSTLREKIGFTR
jgi:fibro-slime domain-containing protein